MSESKQTTAIISIRELVNERLALGSDVNNCITFDEFEAAIKEGVNDAANEIEELLQLRISLSRSKIDNFLFSSISDALIEAGARLIISRNKTG
jgi:hypothetical protein